MDNQAYDQTIAEKRDEYLQEIQPELDKLGAKISEYQAKLEYAQADAQGQLQELVDLLTTQRDAIAQRFEALQQANDEAWSEVQSGFENAWSEVCASFDKAAEQFHQL